MKRYVLLIAAMVGLTTGCQAASPSFSSFYTNHFLTNGLVIKANLNPTQFDTNASSITITITNVSGISGGSHWTNPVGVLKPRSGQTTNVLTFVSGSADNATNTALVVGTVNAWTDANAKLLTLRDVGTDVFYVTPHGSVEIGRSIAPWWLPDEGDILAGVHDVSQGDSDRSVLHIAAVDDAVTTVNFASHTVTLQSGANAQVASTTKAEVGGVESRITVSLVPDQGTADFEIINTGNETFKVNSNSGTFVHNILWALDAFAMPPSLSSNLVVGVNNIDTENEGVFNLVGPNTNPAATFVNLGNGNGVGNFFIVINNAQNSAFTMQDGDPLWDNASAYMRLNGNFVSTNRGDAIFLYHNGWFIAEIGRSYGNTNISQSLWVEENGVLHPIDQSLQPQVNKGWAIGPNTLAAYGALSNGEALVAIDDMADGDAGVKQIRVGIENGASTNAYATVYVDPDNSGVNYQTTTASGLTAIALNAMPVSHADAHENFVFQATALSEDMWNFRPLLTDASTPTGAYQFSTYNTLTSKNLAEFANNGTNRISIGPTGQIIFGPGTTNVLARNGLNLVYEGPTVVGNTVSIGVKRDTSTAYFGVNSAGGAFVQSASNRAILDVGGVQAYWDGTNFLPDAANKNLGTAANPWSKVFVAAGGGNGVFIQAGTGDPNGVVTANVGSLWLRTDGGAGSTLYVKESGSGSAGWAAK